MIARGTAVTSQEELRHLLTRWFADTDEPTLGEVGSYGGKAWLWLELPELPRRARINAAHNAGGGRRVPGRRTSMAGHYEQARHDEQGHVPRGRSGRSGLVLLPLLIWPRDSL